MKDVFEIDQSTGRISLRAGQSPPTDRDQIFLNVTAKDDGSCCSNPVRILSSTALITINIEDEENQKPKFENCNYSPSVKEEQDPGVEVVKVTTKAISNYNAEIGKNAEKMGSIEQKAQTI